MTGRNVLVILRLDKEIDQGADGRPPSGYIFTMKCSSDEFFEMLYTEEPGDLVKYRGGIVWVKVTPMWGASLSYTPKWINAAHIVQVEDVKP